MGTRRTYTHLTQEKRGMIKVLAQENYTLAHIAEVCKVSESTVSRELSRNFSKDVPLAERRHLYSSSDAQQKYLENRNRCRPFGKFTQSNVKIAEDHLGRGWSPEQISNTVLDGLVSFSTLYRWLYAGLLHWGDRTVLRHKGKRRIRRKGLATVKYATGKSIHSRGEAIDSRMEFGHFEVDTVESGRNGSGCVFTIVERKTRKLFAFLSESCTADNFFKAIKSLWKKLPKGAIKSLTGDRGKEFARYADIEKELGIPFYFADPHSPGQKGTNENTNGLIREAFPKGTDFSKVTQSDLNRCSVHRINNRPRKVLGWKKAQDCFEDELALLP